MLILKIILTILLIITFLCAFAEMIVISAQDNDYASFKHIISVIKPYIQDGLLKTYDSISSRLFNDFLDIAVQGCSIMFTYQNQHLIIMSFIIIVFAMEYLGNFSHFVIRHLFHKDFLMRRALCKAIITGNSKDIKHADVMWIIYVIFNGLVCPIVSLIGIF